MNPLDNTAAEMPDIANEQQVEVAGKLDWVGMNEIEMPVRIEDDAGGLIQSSALVTAYVNLKDPDVKGIHMSRLYLHLDQAFRDRTLSPATLRQILHAFLDLVEQSGSEDVVVTTSGCAGLCKREPMATIEMPGQPLGARVDVQAFAQVLPLRRDTGRAIVRIADTRPDTTDRLDRAVGERDAVRPEGHRLDEILRHPKPPGDDQRLPEIEKSERV